MKLCKWQRKTGMMKCIGVEEVQTSVEARYVPSVKTYEIDTGLVTDDDDMMRPYRVMDNVAIWLREDGRFCQLETIYPTVEPLTKGRFARQVEVVYGYPSFQVIRSSMDWCVVEATDGWFRVWLMKKGRVNKRIVYQSLQFLLVNDQLAAIEASDASILLYCK